MTLTVVHLDACASTQDEVRARLEVLGRGSIVGVSASSQRDGRGRAGRSWQDPPGTGLLLSVGAAGPLPLEVLELLPRRIAGVVLGCIERQQPDRAAAIEWKAPNDLVTRSTGAKVAGILVDARSTGDHVDHVIVGLGLNLSGPPFVTDDGRVATSVEAAVGAQVDAERLRRDVAEAIAAELA